MEQFDHLPIDPNLDGTGLTVTALEHGQFGEPHVLMVEDQEEVIWPYVPMGKQEKRLVDLQNAAYQLIRDYEVMNGDDVFDRTHPILRAPHNIEHMRTIKEILERK